MKNKALVYRLTINNAQDYTTEKVKMQVAGAKKNLEYYQEAAKYHKVAAGFHLMGQKKFEEAAKEEGIKIKLLRAIKFEDKTLFKWKDRARKK